MDLISGRTGQFRGKVLQDQETQLSCGFRLLVAEGRIAASVLGQGNDYLGRDFVEPPHPDEDAAAIRPIQRNWRL